MEITTHYSQGNSIKQQADLCRKMNIGFDHE